MCVCKIYTCMEGMCVSVAVDSVVDIMDLMKYLPMNK